MGKKLKKDDFIEKDEQVENTEENKAEENSETEIEKAVREAYERGVHDTEEKFLAFEFERKVEEELEGAKPKNMKALKALIDFDAIALQNGEVKGLSDQLEKLKEECGFLFEDEKKPTFTQSPTADEKTDISGLGYKERLKLYKEMPELYKQLVK